MGISFSRLHATICALLFITFSPQILLIELAQPVADRLYGLDQIQRSQRRSIGERASIDARKGGADHVTIGSLAVPSLRRRYTQRIFAEFLRPFVSPLG